MSMVMVAIMIGVSNIVLEEERSVHDTRFKVEEQYVQSAEED